MKPESTKAPRPSTGIGFFGAFFWATTFAAAYGLAPVFYANQNQYLLHGMAAAGHGELATDWLVNTRDSTPLFSAAVAWMYTHGGELTFLAAHAAFLGVYFVCLISLIDATIGLPRSRPARFVLLTLLLAVHAGAVRYASLYITGTVVPMYLHRPMDAIDIPRYLQFGVAGQYLLGPGLQPSVIGVLLIASLAAFVRGGLLLTAIFMAAACTVHATYLLPAALLTFAYTIVLIRDGRWRAAMLFGIGTLLAVLPIVMFVRSEFSPTTRAQYVEAQRLLAEVRMPHHAVVANWFDSIARFQVAWVLIGILGSMRTRLFPLLAIPAVGALILTLLQLAPGNPAVMDWLRAHGVDNDWLEELTIGSRLLALMFPWRISVVLVPVATAVIVTRVVTALTPYPGASQFWGWLARVLAVVILIAAVAGGIYISLRDPGLIYPTETADKPLFVFIREHRQPGDVYLIPVNDLPRFRLATGAPIYVNWLAIPYKDVEVLEWQRRIEQAKQWYAANDWDAVHDDLVRAGVTNVVVPAERAAPAERAKTLEREFADEAFQVYRVRR